MDSNCTDSFNSIAFESARHNEITHASLSSGSIQTLYPVIPCFKNTSASLQSIFVYFVDEVGKNPKFF